MIRPTNRILVHSSSNSLRDQIVGREIQMRQIRHDRQHARRLEAECVQFLAVELGISEREIDTRGVDAELAPALETLLCQLLVDIHEELRRSDVVVDENLTVGDGISHAGGAGTDGEMMDQNVGGVAGLKQIAIVLRQVLEAVVGRLDEDLGLKPCSSEHALNTQHFVADGVAIAERGKDLMNLRLQFNTGSFDALCSLQDGPDGSSATHFNRRAQCSAAPCKKSRLFRDGGVRLTVRSSSAFNR